MHNDDSYRVPDFEIRPLCGDDRSWVSHLLREHWGSERSVSRGRMHAADELPGFLAVRNGERIGLLTYCIEKTGCEIVTLNSLIKNAGIGTELINSVRLVAAMAGCHKLWLITTNDNVDTLRFYQKRDFTLVAVHRNAIEESRRLKPEIPEIGFHGIPIRDEIELESVLKSP
ncbi:MAG: GNAT family N-acetyltransferase [Candidatus Eisenbacteria bacterium]|uniref:GNAT family N-acetyltransferase n=1 Tax=Eiseniibacteriota bacterium TaxID=2212470 RepID=A0A948WEV4_UNCEI|nr:GNAT family N-acetyltransferase [Candidatus Eisenbacteria bacterium]MBU1948321.1 GNAT family N-acetyltransferase [Candidatus Eisenbacteria bacterium]MBU2693113.1 GNAT family N-acetyltransferase [Candidatus Eisenbacteria bacterium]